MAETNDMTNGVNGTGGIGLPPGTRVGKYEIVGRMAIGGQAIVYRANDTLLDRPVAIKQISSHLAGDERFLERFRREAKILARLGGTHPNVVSVYDFIEDANGLFIVMEYMEGHTLSALLDHQRYALPLQPALEILWHVATGLKAAHDQGIVHRDIKPANLLVNRQFHAKIMDFGVAATHGGQESLAMGTTKYMAPELFEGGTVDVRTDIYSLGFIAYEMFTGREYFNKLFGDVVRDPQSENLRWMKWHSNPTMTVPPLAEINPKIPKELSDIVQKMMSKDPAERYGRIDEAMEDLRRLFGKKRKSAGGAAAGGGKGESSVAGARVDSGGTLELPAEGGEAVDDAPTAVIPKVPMSGRTKAIIAAALGVVLVVGGSILAGHFVLSRSKRENQAQRAYAAARDLYVRGEFAAARERFEELAADFADLEAGRNARARLLMSEAQLAMLAGEWDKADKASEEARALGILEAQEIRDFKNELVVRRDVNTWLDEASDAIAGRRFVDAQTRLERVAKLQAPRDLDERAAAVRKELEDARLRHQFEGLIISGDEAMRQGDFDAAEMRFREAQGLFDNEEAAAKLGEVESGRAYAAAVGRYEAAVSDGDMAGQIEALRQAYRVRPSDELAGRVDQLRAEQAYQRGQAAEEARNWDAAAAAYAESLAITETAKARQALEMVQSRQAGQRLVTQADELLRQGRHDEAIELYRQAMPNEGVAEKLSAALYQKHLAAGDRSLAAKEWNAAVVEYELARAARDEDAAAGQMINARLAAVGQHRDYFALLERAEASLASRRYAQAIAEFGQAEQMVAGLNLPQDYAAGRRRAAAYQQELEKGKAAMDLKQFSTARAYFELARKHMDTEEIRELISQAQNAERQ